MVSFIERVQTSVGNGWMQVMCASIVWNAKFSMGEVSYKMMWPLILSKTQGLASVMDEIESNISPRIWNKNWETLVCD